MLKETYLKFLNTLYDNPRDKQTSQKIVEDRADRDIQQFEELLDLGNRNIRTLVKYIKWLEGQVK